VDRRVLGLIVAGGLLAIVVVVVIVARGGGDSGGGDTTSVADVGSKPAIEVPQGPPPTTLQVKDIETGDGPEAQTGDTLSVKYVGVLYDNGKEFDSNWDTGQPFDFPLGGGQVIQGWDQGLEGMKVGGIRQLIIPPDLAYGKTGQPPKIPPNSALVFDVGLTAIQ
jgi:peptidylprolyl isomerase